MGRGAGGPVAAILRWAALLKGKVAPGYEKVVDVFKRSFVRGLEENAQVCAYVKGREVINLVGYLEKT